MLIAFIISVPPAPCRVSMNRNALCRFSSVFATGLENRTEVLPAKVTMLNRSSGRSLPTTQNTRINPGLEAIVLRALSKSPQRRYASAEQLAKEIRNYLAGQPVTASTSSHAPQSGRGKLLGIPIALVAIVLVLLVIAFRQANKARTNSDESSDKQAAPVASSA